MTTPTDRSYTTMDKSAWGPGPWQGEPDKMQWVDWETDLDCLIVRNHFGALCGYVGVPPEHPWHGVDGRDDIDVHGGLTYAASCQEGADEAEGICHVPAPGRSPDVWWFGFDCGHFHDIMPGMDAMDIDRGLPPLRVGLQDGRVCARPVRQARAAAHRRALWALAYLLAGPVRPGPSST